MPPHLIALHVTLATQSAYARDPYTRSGMALPRALTYQLPQPFPSSISSSDHTSAVTLVTGRSILKNDYEYRKRAPTYTFPLTAAEERRKRNTTTSYRFLSLKRHKRGRNCREKQQRRMPALLACRLRRGRKVMYRSDLQHFLP